MLMRKAGAVAAAVLSLACPALAQDHVNQPCRITAITFSFAQGGNHRTVQGFSGDGCSTSFTGGLNSTYESISVVARPRHLTITPTSNGFGFTVARRTRAFKGKDSYTMRICGRNPRGSGCVRITYDVTID
jgi:hypothetical protein